MTAPAEENPEVPCKWERDAEQDSKGNGGVPELMLPGVQAGVYFVEALESTHLAALDISVLPLRRGVILVRTDYKTSGPKSRTGEKV